MSEIDSEIIIGAIIGFIFALIIDILTDFELIIKIIILCVIGGVSVFYVIYIKVIKADIRQIIKLLEKYEDIKDDEDIEIRCTEKLGKLFFGLRKISFNLKDSNTLKDNKFEMHVTNFPIIHQFLIRRLINGGRQDPDVVYFSKRYNKIGDFQVLNNFIKHLKEKK